MFEEICFQRIFQFYCFGFIVLEFLTGTCCIYRDLRLILANLYFIVIAIYLRIIANGT